MPTEKSMQMAPKSEQAEIGAEELSLAQSWLERTALVLFPPDCAVAVQRYDSLSRGFPLVDDPAIQRATEKRQREFSAGRAAAQTALGKLGLPPHGIPLGPERDPLWPAGIVGSITHTAGLAVAVTAFNAKIAGLGLDLELSNAVKPELWTSLFTETETAWLRSQPTTMQSGLATVFFGAKESFYKLQFPRTHCWVDFHEAEIALSPDAGRFRLMCSQPKATGILGCSEFTGHFAAADGFTLVAMHHATANGNLHENPSPAR